MYLLCQDEKRMACGGEREIVLPEEETLSYDPEVSSLNARRNREKPHKVK